MYILILKGLVKGRDGDATEHTYIVKKIQLWELLSVETFDYRDWLDKVIVVVVVLVVIVVVTVVVVVIVVLLVVIVVVVVVVVEVVRWRDF
ncbi:hypothetical protein ElyMa_005285300 [Elysia marginata]|uniref:Uncharacterized protein n=1 Tax=Elysia marginata TaxID=1093978 RepID=A0AAV4K010_9GAST|nr:hypothetical protein ElyMa_005285300 [Elysia marginata]